MGRRRAIITTDRHLLKTTCGKKISGETAVEYFDGDDDRFSDRRPADKLLNEIFGKPGK